MSAPWHHLVVAGILCLASSSLGFRRVVYFVSLSYALSISAQAIVFYNLFSSTILGWTLIQAALLFTYGVRLGAFILMRSRAISFHEEQIRAELLGRHASMAAKVAMWLGVSLLYGLLFLPCLLTLEAQAVGRASWSMPAGVAIMTLGLLLETAADWQKSNFKRRHSDRFCDIQLYRVVRCPNYLGEIVFWAGLWFAGIAAYETTLDWILTILGFVSIGWVMWDATRRLERKQTTKYGSDPAYRKYARTVPILFPLIPLYSLHESVQSTK